MSIDPSQGDLHPLPGPPPSRLDRIARLFFALGALVSATVLGYAI